MVPTLSCSFWPSEKDAKAHHPQPGGRTSVKALCGQEELSQEHEFLESVLSPMARHDLGKVYIGGETETVRNRSRHTERNRQIKRQSCFNI